MLKTIFLNTLKLLLAGGLIGWLLTSGKLDFHLIARLREHPLQVLGAIFLTLSNFWIVSYRWRKILTARSTELIPMKGMVKVTWIGQFFSSVLPGSVSGDLVKMLYVQHYDRGLSKKFILASILIDRLMGLSGLILLVGLSSIIFSKQILASAPAMAPLLEINYVLSGVVLLSITLFMLFSGHVRRLFSWLGHHFLAGLWTKVIVLWDDLSSIKPRLVKALLLSITVQFTGVLIFWLLIAPFVQGRMDFVQALTFIPLGLMTLALPIAPSGLGVGHAIFQKLFEFAGILNGASLFNLYFVVGMSINVAGAVPYVLSKRKESLKK